VHLPHGRHRLQQDSGRLQVYATGVDPYNHIQVCLEVLVPTDESGLLAAATVVGISTWRAGTTALWIASVEDITALTDDFHTTHDMFT
jgi:hypothetical protein